MKSCLLLLTFWAMQAVAQILFKYGSSNANRWLLFFILGNVFGASSIWLLMLLYRHMNVNVALALAAGGGFLFCQLAVALVYHSRLSFVQVIGILGIAICMSLVTFGERKQPEPASNRVQMTESDCS